MFKISKHIQDELKSSSVKITPLVPQQKEHVLQCIYSKYINLEIKSLWLWERFSQYEMLNDSNAWRLIKDFVGENKLILFFNQEEEKEMFLLNSGNDLDYLLSETYGFEFYITDEESSYLLCFNHHDVLYGCGTAEKWINSIKSVN